MQANDVIDLDFTMLGKALSITVTVDGFGGEVIRDTILTKGEALKLAEALAEATLTLIEYGRSE
jgi:hypothetical protein